MPSLYGADMAEWVLSVQDAKLQVPSLRGAEVSSSDNPVYNTTRAERKKICIDFRDT